MNLTNQLVSLSSILNNFFLYALARNLGGVSADLEQRPSSY